MRYVEEVHCSTVDYYSYNINQVTVDELNNYFEKDHIDYILTVEDVADICRGNPKDEILHGYIYSSKYPHRMSISDCVLLYLSEWAHELGPEYEDVDDVISTKIYLDE